MKRVALVLVVLLACGVAHAEKKRTIAQALSGVGAGVSSALVLASFFTGDPRNTVSAPLLYTGLGTSLITPSLGEWYAGEYLTLGMGVRAVAVGVAVFAITEEQRYTTCDFDNTMQCKSFGETGVVLLGLAAIGYIGGVAYDVMDAGPAVDRFNRKHGIYVAPTALAAPTGFVPGLALCGRW